MQTTAQAPFFSIVMPVYNVDRYIDETLECVVNQTYTSWELIVVDDASPDDSMEYVEAVAANDARIKIITNAQNKGAAESRNIGMDAAQGQYIWFADADDIIDLDLLERVRDEIDKTSAQIILFGLTELYFDTANQFLYSNELPMQQARYSKPEEWRGKIIDMEQSTHFGYTNCKFYDLEFLRQQNVRFKQLLLAEDFAFNVDAFRNASSIAILDGTPYQYRKSDGHSTTNANAYTYAEYYDLVRGRIEAMRNLLEEWGVYDDRAREILGSLYARYVISAIERTYHSNAKLNKTEREEYIVQLMDDPLYEELIPYAKARDSKITQKGIKVLQSRNVSSCARFGKMVNFARTNMYGLFTKARSGR